MAEPKLKPLTPKERLFVAEYLIDKNGTRAYIRAYKTKNENSARALASKLLAKINVNAAVEDALKKQEEALGFTAQDVLRKFWKLAEVDIALILNEDGSLKNTSEWPEGYGKLLAGVKLDQLFEGVGKDREQIGFTKEVKLEGRTPALVALGRYFKLFTDKAEIAGKDGAPLIVRWEE